MPFDLESIEPLATPHLTDYHCHCDYSADARGTIDDYCRAAIRRGLSELCFTTHYDTRPDSDMIDCFVRVDGELHRGSPGVLARYVEDVHRAHEEFYPRGLMIKLGVEIGWWEGCEKSTAELLGTYDFDYVLCGIHELGDLNICSRRAPEKFASLALDDFIRRYYAEAATAARTGLFSALAHLGYYRRYGLGFYGPAIDEAHEPYIGDLFDALKSTGTALEINTSAIRHGLDQYYPPVKIINAAKKAGVQVARLGSDAHAPEQVGLDFDAAAPLVAEHAPYYDE